MTQDKKTIFCRSYIPKEQLIQLLTRIKQVWRDPSLRPVELAGKITSLLATTKPARSPGPNRGFRCWTLRSKNSVLPV